MSTEKDQGVAPLVIATIKKLDERQKTDLRAWLEKITAIRDSSLTPVEKAKRVVLVTARSPELRSTLNRIGKAIRKHGWDDRTWAQRLGVSGAGLALATVGSAGAGVAALGTAVGVSLWVLFAGGETLIGTILDSLPKKTKD